MLSSLDFDSWGRIGSVLGVCIVAIIWRIVDLQILPLTIPRAEIKRLAALMIAQHGSEAEEMAVIKEDRARWRSHTDEQGKWRRVRRELRRRKLAEERR